MVALVRSKFCCMDKLSAQLPLGFCLENETTFDNFYQGKNIEIVAELKKTASGHGEKIIYLCGGIRGEGCSHLLQACCHYAHQFQLSSVYLPLGSLLSFHPEILKGLEALSLVCLDDLHVVSGKSDWEEAIFHLYNRIYDAGGRLIIAARDLPKAIQLKLADLESRLSWGIIYQLHALDDMEKLSVLIMRAKWRGIHLSPDVGKYILTHCPRHMSTLFSALDVLDKASLAAQRRLTIPFVKEILQI